MVDEQQRQKDLKEAARRMGAACIGGLAASLTAAAATVFLQPGQVAIHFGPGGQADGWGSAGFNAAILCTISLLVFAIFFAMDRVLRLIPPSLVNLPNKDYWLAPERIESTRHVFAVQFRSFGAATLLLLTIAQLLAFKANLVNPPHLDEKLFLGGLGLYLVFAGFWLVSFYRTFRR